MKYWTFENFLSSVYQPNSSIPYTGTDVPEHIKKFAPDRLHDPEIIYNFNSHGLRTRELTLVPDKFRIVTSGCSHTMGVAIKQLASWPEVLSSRIPDSVLYNLGHGGASIDYVVRSIFVTIDVLKPDLICVLLPDTARCEIPERDVVLHAMHSSPYYCKNYADPDYQEYQKNKNLEFLKLICQHRQVPLIVLDSNIIIEPPSPGDIIPEQYIAEIKSLARDGMHYGEKWHDFVANSFLNQYNKSRSL